ncbi:MAG TPA: hypothetical protein VE153_12880 [Myxococcus sp.]|nr:hypothetical protein [Myxococcus sp.]
MKTLPSSKSVRPSTPESSQAAPSQGRSRYQSPSILWEQPFVALAQISQCRVPGESDLCP